MKKALILSSLILSTASMASAKQPVDNFSASAITAADYATAETQLRARLARAPGLQQAMLNLAYVYRATGKMAEAEALYTRVLKRPNVQLETTRETPVWSHDVAQRALNASSQ
jgi:thioredoxin-like negative regulator of GroEL